MRRSRAPSNWPGPFFAARSWAGCTTPICSDLIYDRHSLFVVILKSLRFEIGRLLADDMLRQIKHILRNFHVLDLVEVFLRVPNFVGVDHSRASTPAPVAARECRVHNAMMRATRIPSRGRRGASKPNSTKRADVIESDKGAGVSRERRDRAPYLSLNPPSVQYCTDICRREFYSYRIELHLRIVFFAYA